LGVSGGPATKEEKLIMNFNGEVAFKVTTVIKDSKGYISGLIPGDLIIGIDNKPLKNQKFYQGLEDVIGESDNNTAILKIIRDNQIIFSTITLN
jgi:C-terminal processing protease CtpA/Prc